MNDANIITLDMLINDALEALADTSTSASMANWFQGRAQGALLFARLCGLIDMDVSDLLNDAVKAWYDDWWDRTFKRDSARLSSLLRM